MEINTIFEIIPIALELTEEKASTSILFQIYQKKDIFHFSNTFLASYLTIQEGLTKENRDEKHFKWQRKNWANENKDKGGQMKRWGGNYTKTYDR